MCVADLATNMIMKKLQNEKNDVHKYHLNLETSAMEYMLGLMPAVCKAAVNKDHSTQLDHRLQQLVARYTKREYAGMSLR
jgi:hypothetical protein